LHFDEELLQTGNASYICLILSYMESVMNQNKKIFTQESGDNLYMDIRSGTDELCCDAVISCKNAKEFVIKLWQDSGIFLDPKFPSKLAEQFHQHFWELYLAATLHDVSGDAGIVLVEQNKEEGPDILLRKNNQGIWVEAIAVTAGKGKDAVPDQAGPVPDEQIRLRLTSAFKEKFEKYQKYITNGIVSDNDQFIIAINAAIVPSARLERELPFIVRCLLPFGHELLEINQQTLKEVNRTHAYQGEINKKSGTKIPVTIFQQEKYGGISAVIYSCSDVSYNNVILGDDIVVVHNPLARNPLPHDFIKRGSEFFVNCQLQLERREYRSMPQQESSDAP
jgi:type I restriction enzyme S subunit